MAYFFIYDLARRQHAIDPDGSVREECIEMTDGGGVRVVSNAHHYQYREDADAAYHAYMRGASLVSRRPIPDLSYDWHTLPTREPVSYFTQIPDNADSFVVGRYDPSELTIDTSSFATVVAGGGSARQATGTSRIAQMSDEERQQRIDEIIRLINGQP